MRGPYIQTAFAAGYLDKSLKSRIDIAAYNQGASDTLNVLSMPTGGLTLRPGLEWFATIASGGDNARLLRFEFSTEQVYLMVLRALAIDVYLPDGTLAATVVTTYAAAEIADVAWTQSLDTLILVHPDHAPAKLVRSGSHTSWTLSNITLTNIPQYDFGSGDEDVWSVSRGWPRSVFLHQGRLYFGGSKSRPQTVWGSTANSFFDFATTSSALDDEAVELTLDNDRVCAVQGIYALNGFFVFTSGGLFARAFSEVITPSNFSLARQSEISASAIRPVEMDNSVLFISEDIEGQFSTAYEVVYDYTTESWSAEDVATLAEILIKTPVDMAARRGNEENSAFHLFVVNSDGTCAVLNSRKSQKMTAWTYAETDGEFLRVATVGGYPYFLVKRDSAYHIMRMKSDNQLDFSKKMTSVTAKTTWDGLDYAEGETLYLIGDGYPIGEAEVTSGEIETPYAVSTLEAGIPFDWAMETMPVEMPASNGTLIGNRHRLTRAAIRVQDTTAMAVNGYSVSFRALGDSLLDQEIMPFSGIKNVRLLGWSGGRLGQDGATVRLTGTSANKATILSLVAEVSD